MYFLIRTLLGISPGASAATRQRRLENRPDLHAARWRGAELGDLERVVEVAGVQDVVAAERLLGLGERSVGHDAVPDGRRRGARRQAGAAEQGAAQLADLLGEGRVGVEHRGERL